MKRIYLLPNLITTGNLLSGFVSMTYSLREDYQTAALWILVGAICDALDGRIARLAKATSPFGVEYDSLSDLATFGFAPAFIHYSQSLKDFDRLGIAIAFFYIACAAFRLARFNVSTEQVPKNIFQGIPSPVAAGSIATGILFLNKIQASPETFEFFAFIQCLLLGALMVSKIAYPSFKEFNWRSRSSFGLLVGATLCLTVIGIHPEVFLFLINSIYIIGGLLLLVWKKLLTRKSPETTQDLEISRTNNSTPMK